MKEFTFNKVDETIYKEVLDNGISVYLYPFQKTKNFYCTISVNYGSKYTSYKKGNKTYDIIPGSAHFLEHRIMVVGEDPVISKRINDLGSLANAWTGYHATNYNIFGSENINENIRILLDLFYKAKFKEKDIEEEKGIIAEEIDMGKDNIERYLYEKIFKNTFSKSHCVNTVTGEREDIMKISCASLKKIYDDFYIPNNTFIVVCGNFDKDEVINEIKDYYKCLKLKSSVIPKRIVPKEPNEVNVSYEEIKKDMEDVRIKYVAKMKKKVFGIKDDSILQTYISCILKHNFSPTSSLFEEYKNKGIITTMSSFCSIVDDFVVIAVQAVTNNPNECINRIKEDVNKLSLKKDDFERSKKRYIKNFIMNFENIEDVEYIITDSLTRDGKIDYDEYDFLNEMSYETAITIMKKIDTSNNAVIRTIK